MARYAQLRWDYTGLMSATDPFEGSFHVLPPVWAAAHTTQFTEPGWQLLPVGSGSGWLDFGGTYVSYTNNEGSGAGAGGDRQLTIVVEKMDANQSSCQRGERPDDQIAVTKAENVTFILSEPRGSANSYTALVLWSSHFGTSEQQQSESALFVQRDDVPIVNQTVTIEVLPNHAYTLSTVRTATKGGQNKNSNHNTSTLSTNTVGSFPKHYHDDFDKCMFSSLPKYVAPMAGAFECVHAGAGRTGTTSLRQMSPAMSICDRGDVLPYAIIGDGFRTTYNMTMDVLLVSAGGAFVGAPAIKPIGCQFGLPRCRAYSEATGGSSS